MVWAIRSKSLSMKRLLLSLIALCVFVPAFSQELIDIPGLFEEEEEVEDPSILVKSKDGDMVLRISSHIGYGFHSMKSSLFQQGRSMEVFVNLLNLGIYPVDYLGIELSADIEHNAFKSTETTFYLDNGIIRIPYDSGSSGGSGGTGSKTLSSFNYFCVNFPALVKFRAGKMEIGGGAEASFNFGGNTYTKYTEGNRTTTVRERGAKMNLFSYGVVGIISYGGMAFFVKWYPKSSRVVPESMVDLSHMTFGIAFGM